MVQLCAGTARRAKLRDAALLIGLLAAGCADHSEVGPTFPVSGKVTLDNAPISAANAMVLFRPDAARGNRSPFDPSGIIDSGGNYTLSTKGKPGAPLGWYKVIVTAHDAVSRHPSAPGHGRPVARSLVAAKYGLAQTTDLSLEVVETPASGAYDLKLTK